jgi:hypothetical protein
VKSERERSMPCGASEEWRDKKARLEGPDGQRGQVRATWWQEKQDKVVDRSRCRVVAHDRSLHVEFAVVHHKTVGVTWLSHKTKTGGSAGGDGIRVRREASTSADTWRDRRACVGRTQSAATAWLCDEYEYYMTHFPLRGLYHNLTARGSMVFCLAQRDSYILTLGFSGKLCFRTASHSLLHRFRFFTRL